MMGALPEYSRAVPGASVDPGCRVGNGHLTNPDLGLSLIGHRVGNNAQTLADTRERERGPNAYSALLDCATLL